MLKAVGFIIKLFLFSIFVLAVGNWLRWDGKTISDQVKSQLSHAEDSGVADEIRGWTRKITDDARAGFDKKQMKVSRSEAAAPSSEQIPSSERQKLKALIKELNRSN